LTLLAVIIGWIIFRAPDVTKAFTLLGNLVNLGGARLQVHMLDREHSKWQWTLLLALIVFVNVAPTTKQWVQGTRLDAKRAFLLGTLFFICLFLMRTAFLSNKPSEFIYFQF
jgi:alginate O-acetyltransferase complex protein AlgI